MIVKTEIGKLAILLQDKLNDKVKGHFVQLSTVEQEVVIALQKLITQEAEEN